jgi:hypothetical protein
MLTQHPVVSSTEGIEMSLRRLLHRPAALIALMLAFGAVLVGPPAASASPGQVVKFDATGAVFTCADGSTYTVTSGLAVSLFHESTDAAGGLHITGTIAPTNVTLSHSTDDLTYRLAGASWFGGNLTDAQSDFTDTEHFVIMGSSGGPVANVSITAHFTANAQGVVTVEFEKNSGTCTPPED